VKRREKKREEERKREGMSDTFLQSESGTTVLEEKNQSRFDSSSTNERAEINLIRIFPPV